MGVEEGHGHASCVVAQVPSEHRIGVEEGHALLPLLELEEVLDVEEVHEAEETTQVPSEHLMGVEEGHGQTSCVEAQVPSEH